jgi:hypothetical protein
VSGVLESLLAGAGDGCLWVDFDAYAHTVFAGGSSQWLQDPARRAAALEQAQKVVASQVLTIDLLAPFLAAGEPREGSAAAAAMSMLENSVAHDYVNTLLDAVGHRLARDMDIVVALPSPRELLVAAGAPPSEMPDFNDLDDAAMALTDLLRSLSSKPLQALLVKVSEPQAFGADEAEAAATLVAAVRHFGWRIAVATPDPGWPPGEALLAAIDADLYLFPEAPLDALLSRADRRVGGGLGEGFWSASEALPPAVAAAVLYGTIPPRLAPEQVLARRAALRTAGV